MSFLDEVVDLEAQAFEQGREAGIMAARSGDMRSVGVHSGFVKAYPLGLELGFLEASERNYHSVSITPTPTPAQSIANDSANVSVDKDVVQDDDSGGGYSLQSRRLRRQEELLRKVDALPSHNAPTVDFEKELQDLRNLYRLNGSRNGKFLRGGAAPSSSAEVPAAKAAAAVSVSSTW
jgi:hypothetical protein